MTRRLALGALTLSSTLILLAGLVGGPIAELGFAVLAFAFPVLLMILGAAGSDGRLGRVAWPIGALLVVLEACLVAMLVLADGGAWLFGLPAATAIQLYGLIFLPLALTALGFALTFETFGVEEADLERLRELGDDG